MVLATISVAVAVLAVSASTSSGSAFFTDADSVFAIIPRTTLLNTEFLAIAILDALPVDAPETYTLIDRGWVRVKRVDEAGGAFRAAVRKTGAVTETVTLMTTVAGAAGARRVACPM
jgi:hypothetical protein